MKSDPAASAVQRAVFEIAAVEIVDTVAIALVETALRAEPPDRVLHKPRKVAWE